MANFLYQKNKKIKMIALKINKTMPTMQTSLWTTSLACAMDI